MTKTGKTVKEIRNGGRPKLDESERKSKRICLRVDKLTRMAIDEKVKESKLAMGEFLRRALMNAEITPDENERYFSMIDEFNAGHLIELIAVSAKVDSPLTAEENDILKSLYKFAQDVNALIKRGNASLNGKPAEQIDYRKEITRLKQEFSGIKNYFMRRVLVEDEREDEKEEAI